MDFKSSGGSHGFYASLQAALKSGRRAVAFTFLHDGPGPPEKLLVVDGRPSAGSAPPGALERALQAAADGGRPAGPALEQWPGIGPEGADAAVVVEVFEPPPRLVIAGAGHIARPLSKIGALCGFSVTVIDDRPEYAQASRFPEADEVIASGFAEALASLRIDKGTYVVVVTRAHRHDAECLRALRGTEPAYIGMIGSRRRVGAVLSRMAEEGFAQEWLDRIYAPIGLAIGAETPEEIALSIVAELVKVRRGGRAESLRWRPKGWKETIHEASVGGVGRAREER